MSLVLKMIKQIEQLSQETNNDMLNFVDKLDDEIFSPKILGNSVETF